MLELSLDDYQYMAQNGRPYDGMLALGDTGEPYVYDGLSGWFKKVFKKIKKGVKKVARKIKSGVKKLLKKTKFGRWLIKVGGKIKKIAMKIVRPLVKFVGKYAAKLAPIAAMIPGYGTAIAGALMAAGKIANLMQKYGVLTTGKKGKVRTLKVKNPKKNFKPFSKALHIEANKMKKFSKRDPHGFNRLARKMAQKAPVKSPARAVQAATSPSPLAAMALQRAMSTFKSKYPSQFNALIRKMR
jgi:hypothetical protein